MRKFAWLIVILALVAALNLAPRLMAWWSGQSYYAYNPPLQGERILSGRRALLEGRFPKGQDLWLAGTSRTMADFSATLIARELARHLDLAKPPAAYNLGNVANSYADFARGLQKGNLPRLLVLEFSPHIISEPCQQQRAATGGTLNRAYHDYRLWIDQKERWLSGWARRLSLLEGLPRLSPLTLDYLHTLAPIDGHRREKAYYATRIADGAAAKLQADGQVWYWSYLSGAQASRLVHPYAAKSDIANFRRLLPRADNPCQWRAFQHLVRTFTQNGRHLVVLRPPLSSTLLQMENQAKGALLQRVRQFLAENNAIYLDLNPGDYSSADGSHVDWFDTPRLSRRLADAIAARIPRDTFYP